jgi:hypothetical protein
VRIACHRGPCPRSPLRNLFRSYPSARRQREATCCGRRCIHERHHSIVSTFIALQSPFSPVKVVISDSRRCIRYRRTGKSSNHPPSLLVPTARAFKRSTFRA